MSLCCVTVAGFVELQGINSGGRVSDAGCVAQERMKTVGRVVVGIVVLKSTKTVGRVVAAGPVPSERISAGGRVVVPL